VAWLGVPEDGYLSIMMADRYDDGDPDPYASDTDGVPVDAGTSEPPEPGETPEVEPGCPDFDGDAEEEVVCDGSLAPHQTATCTEVAGDIWSLQAIEYKAKSLIEFSLPIYDLPPNAARVDLGDLGGSGWIAEGIIVAFSDKNNNQRFEKGDLNGAEDRLLSASVLKKMEAYYSGKIIFFSEDESDMISELFTVVPEKGFSLVIDDDDGARKVELSDPVQLVPIEDSGAGVELADLQCKELEYHYDFNGSVPTDSTGECLVAEWQISEEGTSLEETYREWEVSEADSGNPCVIHVSTGFACYADISQLPEEWLDVCGGMPPFM
jgi:hypothetical protein